MSDSLQDWLEMHASPVAGSLWPAQIWNHLWHRGSQSVFTQHPISRGANPLTDTVLPSHCWVMSGYTDQFLAFRTTAVYVRDDYARVLRLIFSFLKGEFRGLEDPTPDAVDNAEFLTQTNPFVGFDQPNGEGGSVILTGSPGNGKSLFLHVLLRLRLQARQPTLLQINQQKIYFFTSWGAHLLNESCDATEGAALSRILRTAWCLVDSNTHSTKPSMFCTSTSFTLVEAASPRAGKISWMKKRPGLDITFYIAPFTLEEALMVSSVQDIPSPTEQELQFWFHRFIPSARTAFKYARVPAQYEANVLDGALTSLRERKVSLKDLADHTPSNDGGASDDLPHHIWIQYSLPSHPTQAIHTIPTDYLSQKALHMLETITDKNRVDLYLSFVGIAALAVPSRHLLEDLFHRFLQASSFTPRGLQKLKGTSKLKYIYWSLPDTFTPPSHHLILAPAGTLEITQDLPVSSKPQKLLQTLTYSYDTLKSSKDLVLNQVYIPTAQNEPTLDSFYYDGTSATVFQCTASSYTYDINEKGLSFLQDTLGIKRLVFVGVIPCIGQGGYQQPPTFRIPKTTSQKFNITDHYILQYDSLPSRTKRNSIASVNLCTT